MDVWGTLPNQPTSCICRRFVSLRKIRAFVKGGSWYSMCDDVVTREGQLAWKFCVVSEL